MSKTSPLLAVTYEVLPIENQAILNNKNIDMFCAFWSALAILFPAVSNQNCKSGFKEIFFKSNITGNDFSNGLTAEDHPKIESKTSSNPNLFELNVRVKDVLNMNSRPVPIYISDPESEPIEFFNMRIFIV